MPPKNLISLALVMTIPTGGAYAGPAPTYTMDEPIAATGDGGWDYASVDSSSRQFFVAHGDVITAIDLDTRTSRTIGAIAHGHAALAVPSTDLLLATSGGDASVRLIDRTTNGEVARIAVGDKPDAAVFDPATGHVLVMNADGGSISEIDVAGRKVARTILVKAALEYAAIGRNRTLFVNNEDANEIDTVDLVRGRARRAIALPGCDAPTGIAYDAKADLLISACANGKAAVVDAGRRRLVALIDIGRGPDAVLLDAKRRLAFIPCGRDGVLDILSLDGPGGVRHVGTVTTEIGARTGALDPATGTIYLPTARFGASTATAKRPPVMPGTFHVLVVRPA